MHKCCACALQWKTTWIGLDPVSKRRQSSQCTVLAVNILEIPSIKLGRKESPVPSVHIFLSRLWHKPRRTRWCPGRPMIGGRPGGHRIRRKSTAATPHGGPDSFGSAPALHNSQGCRVPRRRLSLPTDRLDDARVDGTDQAEVANEKWTKGMARLPGSTGSSPLFIEVDFGVSSMELPSRIT